MLSPPPRRLLRLRGALATLVRSRRVQVGVLFACLLLAAAVPWTVVGTRRHPSAEASDPTSYAGAAGDLAGALVGPPLPLLPVTPNVSGREVQRSPRLVGRLGAAGSPVRIRVPRLGVNSAVVPISGNSGVLEPPGDATRLGWWQEGAVPGADEGTTVVTGHTLHLGGGALDKLKSLRPGDRISVSTTSGTVRYEVRASWALSKPELAQRAEDLFDQSRDGRLVLVTCYDWTGSEYLSNAVVSAAPIGSSTPTAP